MIFFTQNFKPLDCQIHGTFSLLTSPIVNARKTSRIQNSKVERSQREYGKTSRWAIEVVWARDYCGLDWECDTGEKERIGQYIIWRLTC